MLSYLLQYYSGISTSKINTPKYNQFLSNVEKISLNILKKEEAIKSIPESYKGYRFIFQLLSIFPYELKILEKIQSNTELLSYIDDVIQKNLPPFYIYAQKNYLKDTFIHNNTDFVICNEIILYTINLLPLKYYPIHYPVTNLDICYRMCPLKCTSIDSEELTINTSNFKLTYDFYFPEYAFFVIDVKLLLFIWYKYIINRIKSKKEIINTEFYRDFVHLPWIHYNINNWILHMISNVINDISSGFDLHDISLDSIFYNTLSEKFSKLDSYIEAFINELIKRLTEIQSNSLQPIQILSSYSLLPKTLLRDSSISSYIEYVSDLNIYIDHPKFQWITVLKDYPFVKLLIDLYSLYSSNTSKYKSFIHDIAILVARYKRNKVWDHCKDMFLKHYIKNNIIGNLERLIINSRE